MSIVPYSFKFQRCHTLTTKHSLKSRVFCYNYTVTLSKITLSSNKIQNGDILVPANPGPPGKWCTCLGPWDVIDGYQGAVPSDIPLQGYVTWATSEPILVFLCLSVLDLGPMYATDVRQTSDRSIA